MSKEKKVTIAEMFEDKDDFNWLMDSFDKFQQKADGRDIKKVCQKNKEHLTSLGVNPDFLPFYLMKKLIDKAIEDGEKKTKAIEEAEKMVKDLSNNVVEDVSGDVVEHLLEKGEAKDISSNPVEDISSNPVDISGNGGEGDISPVEAEVVKEVKFEKDLSNNIMLNINDDKKETKEEETQTETISVPESDPEADNNS